MRGNIIRWLRYLRDVAKHHIYVNARFRESVQEQRRSREELLEALRYILPGTVVDESPVTPAIGRNTRDKINSVRENPITGERLF